MCRRDLFLAVMLLSFASPLQARTWYSVGKTFSVEAEFVELKQGKVVLRRSDGSLLEVELEKLSVEDQQFARQQAETTFQELFADAEDAMRRGDLAEGFKRLDEAEDKAASQTERERLASARKLHAQLAKFWDGVARGGARLSAASDLEIKGMTVFVVESADNRLVIRVSGRNCRFALDKPETIPAALAAALAGRGLDGAAADAAIAAFESLHPENRDRDRQLWEVASGSVPTRGLDPASSAPPSGSNNSFADLASELNTGSSSNVTTGNRAPLNSSSLVQHKPIPNNEIVERKLVEIRQVLAADYANAKDGASIMALAKKLYDLGQKSYSEDPASSYALLVESAVLTADTGDARAALTVLDSVADMFDGSRLVSRKADCLERAAKTGNSAEQVGHAAQQAFGLVNEALQTDDIDAAKKLNNIALVAARRLKDRKLVALATERGKELQDVERRLATIRAARKVLDQQPDDAAANRAMGIHLCFAKGDWQQGLPHLEKSGDERLTSLAKADRANPTEANQIVGLADAWWQLAESEQSEHAGAIKQHAAQWYRQALPQLSGLIRVKAEKRVEVANNLDISTNVAAVTARTDYLVNQPLLEATGLWLGEGHTVHSAVKLGGKSYEHGIWAHPAKDGITARISYKLGKQFSELRGIAGISDNVPNARAWSAVDFALYDEKGRLLWASRPLRERGEAQALQANVRGVETLYLMTKPRGSYTYCHAVWGDLLLLK